MKMLLLVIDQVWLKLWCGFDRMLDLMKISFIFDDLLNIFANSIEYLH